uniref:Tail protein n=1 Tax=viral metagenome TaxID=1070528 RepID=A0A6M3K0L1_9ZZZZ
MATFPTVYVTGTLAHQPQVSGFSDRIAQDPTIRSPKDAGYVKTRTRFTRYPRSWDVVFNALSTTNKNTILAFEEARGVGGESFTWAHPDGTSYTVRFAGVVQYRPWEETNYGFWVLEFTLEEV